MRTFVLALAMIIALPALLAAQPKVFRVVGVAADDTLNVRSEPRASSHDIGDLPHNATGVEVAGTDASGKWGSIVWEDGNAWVSMRFLAPDTPLTISGTGLPAGLMCAGTEPFWSIQFSEHSATYSSPDGEFLGLTLAGSRVAEGRPNFPVQLGHGATDGYANSLVKPGACSDGMSDRTYPWQIDLLLNQDGVGRYLVGCCHLPLEVGFH